MLGGWKLTEQFCRSRNWPKTQQSEMCLRLKNWTLGRSRGKLVLLPGAASIPLTFPAQSWGGSAKAKPNLRTSRLLWSRRSSLTLEWWVIPMSKPFISTREVMTSVLREHGGPTAVSLTLQSRLQQAQSAWSGCTCAQKRPERVQAIHNTPGQLSGCRHVQRKLRGAEQKGKASRDLKTA